MIDIIYTSLEFNLKNLKTFIIQFLFFIFVGYKNENIILFSKNIFEI